MKIHSLFIFAIVLGAAACQSQVRLVAPTAWGCGDGSLELAWAKMHSRIPDAESAKRLAAAVLCAKEDEMPEAYIRDHLDDLVTFVSYGTGEPAEERRVLDRSAAKEEVSAYRGSPDYTYSLVLDDSGNLELNARNEACSESVLLRHRKEVGGWVVSQYDSACD